MDPEQTGRSEDGERSNDGGEKGDCLVEDSQSDGGQRRCNGGEEGDCLAGDTQSEAAADADVVAWNDVTADSDTGVASGLGYLDVNRRMYWCPMCPEVSQQRHTRYLEGHICAAIGYPQQR